MTKNPRGYPDQIELKVEDEVGSYSDDSTFNTRDQQKVAHALLENWPIRFQDLAEGEDFSRQMVPNVLESYFGPVDDDITFGEIEDKYGGYKQYQSRRRERLGEIDLPDDIDLSKRELDLYIKGQQDGFEDGYERGRERGYREALEELETADEPELEAGN